jgi:DnaJ-class molecular chaperone
MIDYYAILKVDSHASQETIRTAYRKMAQQAHPDKSMDVGIISFSQLTEAYHVLCNERRRAAYDEKRVTMLTTIKTMQCKMTWKDGLRGFITELKKELHNKQE